MTYLDEYQWRYRQPAPSLHEVFAEMAANRSRQWRRQHSGGALSLRLQPCYYWA
jgi:hypothetical protein